MSSLKDQLLKAGLVDEQKIRQSKKKSKPATKPKKARAKVGEATLRAQRAMLDKAKKDKKLNLQKQQDAQKKAKIAEIKQLIDANKLDREGGEHSFNFTFAKKVKKLYVTQEQQELLAKGKLGIVTLGKEQFDLVPVAIAEKIGERDQNFVVKLVSSNNESDDEYSEYQIPDDLTW